MKENIISKFKEVFGDGGDIRTYFAPGRVNLIGEYTDFNGGHVFPCALTIGTYAAARKNNDGKLRFYSMNFEELGVIENSIDDLAFKKEDDWANYPKGIIKVMLNEGYGIDSGFDVVYNGNIPNSSGLSSSASIEVLTCFILTDLFGLDVDFVKNALIGQKAENEYVGVNCGIMDQFAIAMGKENAAVFLDTATLDYTYVPVTLGDAKIVIMNTNKKRGLNDSKYNERRAECEEALADLQTKLDIKTLGDLDEKTFDANQMLVKNPVARRRAKHAVYENQRTIKAVDYLKAGDLKAFGGLLNESHISLRDDFEVTGKELDTLASAAWHQEGVLGARMTGAGFGGCGVAIVKTANVEAFIKNVGDIYRKEIGYDAAFYVVEVGNGPSRI
ncbi:MAG: galactokinase [Lachnospiraceae bacterium]|nr:galactokinase [Lachnospiraceae bacterium]